MIPITKNIIVVDEFGNEYEPTYIKRAKGLVKNGRARFISDNRICLTRSPIQLYETVHIKNSEDKSVENNINSNAEFGKNEVTAAEILRRIDKIIEDTDYLERFISAWETASANSEGVVGMQSVVLARETTNQRMIDFLERIYDDLSPTRNEEPANLRAFNGFIKALEGTDVDLESILMGGPFGPGAFQYFFGSVGSTTTRAQESPKHPKTPKRGRNYNGDDFRYGKGLGGIINKTMEQVFNSAGASDEDNFDDDEE